MSKHSKTYIIPYIMKVAGGMDFLISDLALCTKVPLMGCRRAET